MRAMAFARFEAQLQPTAVGSTYGVAARCPNCSTHTALTLWSHQVVWPAKLEGLGGHLEAEHASTELWTCDCCRNTTLLLLWFSLGNTGARLAIAITRVVRLRASLTALGYYSVDA